MLMMMVINGCSGIRTDIGVQVDYGDKPPVKITETSTYTYSIATNYIFYETKTAYVGATMIRVEDAVINTEVKDIEEDLIGWDDYMLPVSFEVRGKFQGRSMADDDSEFKVMKYNSNTLAKILGSVQIEDGRYLVIAPGPKNSKLRYLVDKNGFLVTNKFIKEGFANWLYDDSEMTITPSVVRFPELSQLKENKLTKSKQEINRTLIKAQPVPEINFELIYGGLDATGLHVVYREYTKDGMARQAFYQNLNYEKNAKIIRFKNTKFEIVNADNQKIVFKVVEDDIKSLEAVGNALLPKPKVTKK
jgi:hypothetical protein